MPATYVLPPDTRAVGTGNPPADMNAVVDVLNHSLLQRVFYLDQYGADPTGVATSDAAWTACYTDAAAAVQSTANGASGALIVLGAGIYRFSVNTVIITDQRIGFKGQGRFATCITTTGSTGDVLFFSDTSGLHVASAPISGFGVYGWSAGAAVNGIHYGDRASGTMTDVSVYGFGGAGSRGYWFKDDHGGLSEGCFFQLNADQNTVNYDFDGAGGGITSFDYSHMFLHNITVASARNTTALRFINSQHMYGGSLHLSGNVSSTNASFTATAVQVGGGASDGSRIQAGQLQVTVEADTASGSVFDIVVNTSAGNGIANCNGPMSFLNASASFTAGSVTGGVVTCAGYLNGPLFSSHGVKSNLGTGTALSTYVG